MTDQLPSKEPQDIVDELEARGDDLSMRAARYIRIKRGTARDIEGAYRRLGERLLEEERHG
jgi:hypothetical protein